MSAVFFYGVCTSRNSPVEGSSSPLCRVRALHDARLWGSRKVCVGFFCALLGGEDTQSVWVEEVEWMEDTQEVRKACLLGREQKRNENAVFKGNSNKCTGRQTGIAILGVNILKPPNHVILQQIYQKTRYIHMQHATAICRKNLHRRGTKPRPSTGPLPNIPSPFQLHCTTNQSLKRCRRSCPGYPSVIDRVRCIQMLPCTMWTYEKTSPPGSDETGFLTGGSVASHGRGVTNVLKQSRQTL